MTLPLGISIRPIRSGAPRRECEVQPHQGCPNGCHEGAAYEVRVLDAVSWLCSDHFWKVKAELDRGAPLSILPDPGQGRN